jgi:hypothetical protein
MNDIPFTARRFASASFALALAIICSTSLSAQTVFPSLGGGELRYSGDTIWRERDTTTVRIVFRGDTATRTSYMHGKATGSQTYVLKGDDALLVDQRDADGKPRALLPTARVTSAIVVMGERMLLESAVKQRSMTQRMSGMGVAMPGNDAPLSPATPQMYAMSANRNLVQHLDTVRYITGCVAAGPVDTTVYVLFANDSLRRLSPSPRTFGRAMVAAVRSDMGGVLLRQRVALDPAEFKDLPGPKKWPCDRR